MRYKKQIPVRIPTLDGMAVAETITVEVEVERDDAGVETLDGAALAKLDAAKARHMGLLLPHEIKQMRLDMKLTQSAMSTLLQIGQKTYTRWEIGRERPSRSLNLLLRSLADRRIDPLYLTSLIPNAPHEPRRGSDVGSNPLLDCPFCGRKGETQAKEPGAEFPQCTGCTRCDVWFFGENSESEWNTRYQSNANLTGNQKPEKESSNV